MGNQRAIILADGDWGESTSTQERASPGDFVIAADGGYLRALERGWRVDEIVGDLDSVDEATRERLFAGDGPPVFAFPEEKDWTDLELALNRAFNRSPREILVLGALGQRIDHTLANLHLLELGLARGVPIVLISDQETVRLIEGRFELSGASIGDRVSLLPQSEIATVSTEGLQFPLERDVLRRAASRGVSNVVHSVPAFVTAHEGLLFVIHARGERTSA